MKIFGGKKRGGSGVGGAIRNDVQRTWGGWV